MKFFNFQGSNQLVCLTLIVKGHKWNYVMFHVGVYMEKENWEFHTYNKLPTTPKWIQKFVFNLHLQNRSMQEEYEYLKHLTMPELFQEYTFILFLQNRNMQQEINFWVKYSDKNEG